MWTLYVFILGFSPVSVEKLENIESKAHCLHVMRGLQHDLGTESKRVPMSCIERKDVVKT
jgi:hypothetical protein